MSKDKGQTGSTVVNNVRNFAKELEGNNDMSSILFEKKKEEIKSNLLEAFSKTWETAFNTIEKWEEEVKTIDKPDSVMLQQVGDNPEVEVKVFKPETKKKIAVLKEKLATLTKLFDEACQKSTKEAYDALDKFLSKNK